MEGKLDTYKRLPSGRHGLSAEAVARSQRDRLETALIEVVAERGYPATTIREVCTRAGVSKASFYQHFADLEGAVLAAYDAVVVRLGDSVRAGYESVGAAAPWPDRVRSGLEALLEFLAENEAFARMSFVEILGAGGLAVVRRQNVIAGFRSYFDPEVQVAMEGWPDRPGLVAEAVIDAIYGFIYSRILEGRARELPQMLDDIVYIALLPYEPPERATRQASSGPR